MKVLLILMLLMTFVVYATKGSYADNGDQQNHQEIHFRNHLRQLSIITAPTFCPIGFWKLHGKCRKIE